MPGRRSDSKKRLAIGAFDMMAVGYLMAEDDGVYGG